MKPTITPPRATATGTSLRRGALCQTLSRALCEVPTRAHGLQSSPAHCLLGIALQVCNPTPCFRRRLALAYETRSTEARATDHAVSSKRGAGSEGRA